MREMVEGLISGSRGLALGHERVLHFAGTAPFANKANGCKMNVVTSEMMGIV